jgi:hypothetical protein
MSAVRILAAPLKLTLPGPAQADDEIVHLERARPAAARFPSTAKSTRRPRAPLTSSVPVPVTRAERRLRVDRMMVAGCGALPGVAPQACRLRRIRKVVP